MNFAKLSVLSDALKTAPTNVLSLPSALDTSAMKGLSSLADRSGSSAASAIAFIDADVPDYQTLLAGIAPGTEVHLLNDSQDAVTQITNTLLGRHNISSLHIVSHGEAGGLDFGSSKLNLSDLPDYAAQLQSWSKALTNDADLLLYGCNVAQGELGKVFVNILSQLTGADVAASDNLTGSSALRGDWTLEYQTGKIEASTIANPYTQAIYDHILSVSLPGYTESVYVSNSGTTGSALTIDTSTRTLYFTDTGDSLYKVAPNKAVSIVNSSFTGGFFPYVATDIQYGAGYVYSSVGGRLYQVNTTTGASTSLTNLSGLGGDEDGIAVNGNTIYITSGNTGAAGQIVQYNLATNTASTPITGTPANPTNIKYDPVANKFYFAASPSGFGSGVSFYQANPTAGTFSALGGSTSGGYGHFAIDPSGQFLYSRDLSGNINRISTVNGAVTTFETGLLSTSGYDGLAFGSSSSGNGFSLYVMDGTRIMEVSGFAGPNAAPIITASSTPLSYTENNPATLIDSTATVADTDSTNFDTGTLTVNYSANGTVDDRLAINNQGTSAGQIGVAGSNVTYGGTTIGTFTGGVGTTPLIVTFNSNSSPAAAEALLRNLTYSNISDAPSTSDRTLSVVLTDGDGGTSTTANKTISVTAVNDAPTVTAPSAIAVTEDLTTALTGIVFADVDAGSGIVTATLSVGAGTLAATAGSGVTVGGTATNLTLGGTLAAINSFIAGNSLTYTTAPNDTATQTLGVSINDGGNTGSGGALSSAVTNVALNITAVNDAPTVTAPSAIAVTEDTPTTLTGISFADVDAGSGTMSAVLSVGAGTLTATAGNGVTVAGSASSSITLNGTLTALNSFLTNGLTYTPALNNVTTQTLGVSINDGGNTGTGGALSSGVTNVNLTVTPVNDAPSFTKGTNQTITAGAGVQTITNWATGFNPGPADEASQTVQAYLVNVDTNASIFAVAPAIDTFGNLTYTPATNLTTATTATISVKVQDNGGISNSGIDTSTAQTFTITVKPQPTISITPISQNEGNSGTTAYTFTVSLSDTSTQTVSVNYATADSTATIADGDYSSASGTLTFAPGDTSKTFTVNGNGDTKYENTEAFLVNLSNAVNGTIANGSTSVNGTITNDDSVPTANITPTVTHAEGNSGTTPYVFTVTLSNPSAQAIALNYSTVDSTATVADGDYTAATGTVNFAAGETSKTITVNATGDTKFESDETFQVSLTGSANGSGAVNSGSTSTGSGSITNDDTQPTISIGNVSQNEGNSGTTAYTFAVNLSNASAQTVSVNYTTADGTATVADSDYIAASGTLSFAPGQTSKTITVLVNGDTKFEADQTFSLALSNASNGTLGTSTGTGTITNDDTQPTISIGNVSQNEGNSGTTAYTFAVNLTNASEQTVSVNYTTADGTATVADNDYTAATGSLSFTPGETSKTITVLAKGDTKIETDQTFSLALSNASNGTLGSSTGTGTIVNDDPISTVIWQLNGTTFSTAVQLPTVQDTNWQMQQVSDFDGDGKTDLLWRNTATGQNLIWKLNGTTFSTAVQLPTVQDTNWKIQQVSDFDGDGKTDLLWRNTATGQNLIWKLNGTTFSTAFQLPTVQDTNWKIQKVSDFDGDGKTDLLWRNTATGQNLIWKLNGTTFSTAFQLPTVQDTNWQMQQVSDFDGDGKTDLLWRNTATGQNIIWKLNGTTFSTAFQLPTVQDTNWKIQQVSDFDGDGKTDLLWRNTATGQNLIWKLNGTTFSTAFQLPTVQDTNWKIQQVSDFNGDGKTDLLWQNVALV